MLAQEPRGCVTCGASFGLVSRFTVRHADADAGGFDSKRRTGGNRGYLRGAGKGGSTPPSLLRSVRRGCPRQQPSQFAHHCRRERTAKFDVRAAIRIRKLWPPGCRAPGNSFARWPRCRGFERVRRKPTAQGFAGLIPPVRSVFNPHAYLPALPASAGKRRSPHQFRTRNDRNETQQTRSNVSNLQENQRRRSLSGRS
jgi:hypothetical protein